MTLTFGCSTQEKSPEKEYSEDTNHAFSMIEHNARHQEDQVKKNEKSKLIQKTTPVLKIMKQKNVSEEKMIETNQKLAFYCMKNGHLKKYQNNESLCHRDVNAILKSCQIKYHESQIEVINCLNRKLKIRS